MTLIETKHLTKIYGQKGSETQALCDISFTVNIGEFIAIMGPSGSGKSTLLHILGFLDKQTGGEYFFEGKTIDNFSPDELAHIRNKKMGFVFQQFNLLPRVSVLENVKLPLLYSDIKRSMWDKLALERIEAVGLTHRINHISNQLSGGEKQRVAIARALINNPDVLFADEPTGNLDSKTGKGIMEILQSLNVCEKKTVILITHETYTAEHAQRIVYIRDGKIENDRVVQAQRHACDGFKK